MILKLDRALCDLRASIYGSHPSAIEDVVTDEGVVDNVVTDPPYAERVDANARRGKASKNAISVPMALGFDPATTAKRARWASWIATATRKWALVFSDHESSMDWAGHLERAGLVYVRCALWVRTGDELGPERIRHSGAPQFTGDRPAVGHEVIVVAHKGRRFRWRGRGKAAIYTHPIVHTSVRVHPTEKPVGLMHALLRDFVTPGETVCDPFVGSGATLVAAKSLGMPAFGIDRDPKWADYAARRAAGARTGS